MPEVTKRNFKVKFAIIAAIFIATSLPSMTYAFTGDTTYKYDAQGRLIEVNYPNGAKITYNYDAAGNRTQVVKTI